MRQRPQVGVDNDQLSVGLLGGAMQSAQQAVIRAASVAIEVGVQEMRDRFVSRVGRQLDVFEQAVERVHAAGEIQSDRPRAGVFDRRGRGRTPQWDHAVAVTPPGGIDVHHGSHRPAEAR